MHERPWFVKADDWDKMDDALKCRVAGKCPSPCQNVPIDPQLETAPAASGPAQRIHNADRDGPNGLPYSNGERRDTESAVRARSLAPTQQVERRGVGHPERHERAPSQAPVTRDATASLGELGLIASSLQSLVNQNHEMNERLKAVEEHRNGHKRAHRGGFATRGGSKRAKKSALRQGARRVVENDEDRQDEDAEDVLWEKNMLSTKAQTARKLLQERVSKKFRRICNVGVKDKWPDPSEERFVEGTNERYYTPNFAEDVKYEGNVELFEKVAELVLEDLKDQSIRDPELKDPKIRWNRSSLIEFAKDKFRHFKSDWKAQEGEKRRKREISQRKNRWAQRRTEKYTRLLNVAVPLYKEKHGVDPTVLLCADHMSDEASGPEDGDEEDVNDWKRRMFTATFGTSDTTDVQLKGMKFQEVIKPNWRSDELSAIFHELRNLWWDFIPMKQQHTYHSLRVTGTQRNTNDPPLMAPFNFGINNEWLEEHGERYAAVVGDWGEHPDPDGFGAKKGVNDQANNNEGQ
ncbi:hypothetical protein BD410DRAFT_843958 [Rickenella mellea]|uniref:Uncharacterized protein n=1 Tax=Rickenella mellea TaxID=50990 RepID=A0A4Y7PNR3_9AGAM|nr:hypothetical protein BD410DRAFT_843958 [Rickenella mellea]